MFLLSVTTHDIVCVRGDVNFANSMRLKPNECYQQNTRYLNIAHVKQTKIGNHSVSRNTAPAPNGSVSECRTAECRTVKMTYYGGDVDY